MTTYDNLNTINNTMYHLWGGRERERERERETEGRGGEGKRVLENSPVEYFPPILCMVNSGSSCCSYRRQIGKIWILGWRERAGLRAGMVSAALARFCPWQSKDYTTSLKMKGD